MRELSQIRKMPSPTNRLIESTYQLVLITLAYREQNVRATSFEPPLTGRSGQAPDVTFAGPRQLRPRIASTPWSLPRSCLARLLAAKRVSMSLAARG